MATNFDFEISVSSGTLTAQMIDSDSDVNNVLDKALPCSIRVQWNVLSSNFWTLAGTQWRLEAYAESIGPGDEKLIGTLVVPIGNPPFPPPASMSWDQFISIPANTISTPATYKVSVLLTHEALDATNVLRKTRMAGFYEIPLVQFLKVEF